MKALTASMLVSVIVGLYLLSLYMWFLLISGLPFANKWLVTSALVAVTSGDYFLFVSKDRGDLFEDEFYDFSPVMQRALYFSAAAITVGSIVVFIVSVIRYHQAIGIID
jgi:hypothetical protein